MSGVQTVDSGRRKARKSYRCGLCTALIEPRDLYAFQTNVYDGRIYTWRDCLHCDRDGVIHYVEAWTGGYDEGVTAEAAEEWAEDSAWFWPLRQSYARNPKPRRISTDERRAARAWLARAAGGEGE